MRMFLLSLLLSNSVLAADARARLEAFANGLNALSGVSPADLSVLMVYLGR